MTITPSVLDDPKLWENDSDGFDGHAHYAPRAGLVEAMINGTYVTALCGFRFIPYRNPENFPVCPRCAEIHKHLPS